MKMYVTIEEVKKSIPGYVDYGKDDERLTMLLEAAHVQLERRLQRPLSDEGCQDEEGRLQAPLRAALIIKTATLYDTPSEISFARPYNTGIVEDLIATFIRFRGGEEEDV